MNDATKARLEYLREKANFGRLSDVERAEYEKLVENMDQFAIQKLKSKAIRYKEGS